VTEIPEHLLKRSKERRAAIGGEESGSSGAAEDAAATPAAPAASTPAAAPAPAAASPAEPAPPPPPEPVRPEVEAYHRRRRIPYWALPVLAAIPLWAYMFQATLEPPPAGIEGGLAVGEQVYGSCAGCHGGTGGGVGSTPGLDTVVEDFPDYRDHMMWIRVGSQGWPADTYGATDKPVAGGMPPHPALSDEELAAVTLYERQMFGGLGEEEEEELREIADGEDLTFAEVGLGEQSEAAGVPESALEPGG
jgi:mono/diheme cytochrome c family protein